MSAFIARNPRWACAWAAGFLYDLAGTLPPEDPWRRLSATLDLAQLSLGATAPTGETWLTHRHPQGAAPPETTGAVLPDGRPFGTPDDSADILFPDLTDDPAADISRVGLVDPLDDYSAAITGFTSADIQQLHDALTALHYHLWLGQVADEASPTAGARFLEILTPAVHRLAHRRRIYVGGDDPFTAVAGFAWMARADRITTGGRIEHETLVAHEGQIDPDAYRDLLI